MLAIYLLLGNFDRTTYFASAASTCPESWFSTASFRGLGVILVPAA